MAPLLDDRHPRKTGVLPLLRKVARAGLGFTDAVCGPLSRKLVRETPSLIVLALHALCSTRSQVDSPLLAPNQNISVEDFRTLVDVILESGYTLVSPAEVAAGLAPAGKYVMLTFDDGYFNNVLALDVLEQYRVPATFFVSSNHVLEQKAFWWDALNRELVRAGASAHAMKVEVRKVKKMEPGQIDAYLHSRFGAGALKPQGDKDRPFSRGELQSFARHRWVHLGNHTCDHAILTHCSPEEVERQIQGCQEALTEMAGYSPDAIAYPNGNFSPAVVEAARAAGLRMGMTVRPCRNRLPLRDASGTMTLGRFYLGGGDAQAEFLKCRAGLLPSNVIKSLLASI